VNQVERQSSDTDACNSETFVHGTCRSSEVKKFPAQGKKRVARQRAIENEGERVMPQGHDKQRVEGASSTQRLVLRAVAALGVLVLASGIAMAQEESNASGKSSRAETGSGTPSLGLKDGLEAIGVGNATCGGYSCGLRANNPYAWGLPYGNGWKMGANNPYAWGLPYGNGWKMGANNPYAFGSPQAHGMGWLPYDVAALPFAPLPQAGGVGYLLVPVALPPLPVGAQSQAGGDQAGATPVICTFQRSDSEDGNPIAMIAEGEAACTAAGGTLVTPHANIANN
jgi:hypothetical protein